MVLTKISQRYKGKLPLCVDCAIRKTRYGNPMLLGQRRRRLASIKAKLAQRLEHSVVSEKEYGS